MACKIVLIGGGSYIWTPKLVSDMFLRKSLNNSTLALVDIDSVAVERMRQYCSLLASKLNVNWNIEVSDRNTALRGADYVCISISTGGLPAFQLDYDIPEGFGVFHSTGDTVGPAGISRTLRNVPVFVEIARVMEKLCPQAWLIHVTNPLSQLTRAVCLTSQIKCVGLCHNYYGTQALLADLLGVEYDNIDAVSVGVNHATWLKGITCNGKPVAEELNQNAYRKYVNRKNGIVTSNTSDDDIERMTGAKKSPYNYMLNFELYERFGYFPVGSPAHVAENLPWYLNSIETISRHHINRKGVLPWRQDGKEELKEKIIDIITGKVKLEKPEPSREALAGIIESLHIGIPSRHIAAMPNIGQVGNMPDNVIVETWAEVSGTGIQPEISGPVPFPLAGWILTLIEEQELTVQAAIEGDIDKVIQAMIISPLLHNKDAAPELTRKLLEAHKEFLPQFDLK